LTFEQLKSLHISNLTNDEDIQENLQSLINRTPRLDLLGLNYNFNEQQCNALGSSLLGIHCEVLSTYVEN
jgi:hypothetical protein